MSDITALLVQARDGDRAARERLFAALYDDLRRVARGQLAGGGVPLQATSLVHEAYYKLARGADFPINDREHFYAIAARVMRQIVVDHIRSRDARRRGGDVRVDRLGTTVLDAVADPLASASDDLLALDRALDHLAAFDAHLANVVELRFYAGLELAEIAALVGRSERSLKRDWRKARAFLHAEIGGDIDGVEARDPVIED